MEEIVLNNGHIIYRDSLQRIANQISKELCKNGIGNKIFIKEDNKIYDNDISNSDFKILINADVFNDNFEILRHTVNNHRVKLICRDYSIILDPNIIAILSVNLF